MDFVLNFSKGVSQKIPPCIVLKNGIAHSSFQNWRDIRDGRAVEISYYITVLFIPKSI